jgi:formamidopyrimidine-DNA glycosylase
MPELPEVETIARWLREGDPRPEDNEAPPLVGRTVQGSRLLWERTLAAPTPVEFARRILGQQILDIGRRGKFVVFHLTDAKMLVHLRMTGDLFVETQSEPFATHHRLVLDLDHGLRLAFNDTRKFGRVWLVADIEAVVGKLGPEPLDEGFTPDIFFKLIQNRRRQLKPLLLDQHFIAGIGNIYADEALFLSRLHPQTLASRVDADQAGILRDSIQEVLREGINRHGASIDWAYRGGEFQNQFQVYGRTGEACYRCETPIERILVGQRSTHFCPTCQPPPLQ